ncbi:hypothetical protein Golob_025090, partial [Gossypium lobatum]|nr:hypothetical protein [Gossypium lobatum]
DSVRIDEGFVADGGYVSEYNGEWIIEFSRYLENCTMLENTLIQTGCIEAINAIMEDSSGNSNFALVKRIHCTLKMFKQWKIQHIPREENLIVDSLAKTIQTRRIGLRLFEDPSSRGFFALLFIDDHQILHRNFSHRLGSFNVILTGVAAVAAAVAAAAVDAAAGSGVDHGAAVFIGVFAVVGTQH